MVSMLQSPPAEAAELVCRMTLAEYTRYCCTGKLPRRVREIVEGQPSFLRDLVCAMDLIGMLEPLAATRPGACDPVMVVDRQIVVPAATKDLDGKIVPAERRAISYCAPVNRALVVAESRITAGNLTGASQPVTQPIYKKVNLGTFGEWCLPFEPPDAPGQFANVEHVVMPPEAGYSVYVQNWDTESEAVYHVHSRMWASC